MKPRRTARLYPAALLFVLCLGLTGWARADLTAVSGAGNILNPAVTSTGATANFFNDTGSNVLVHGWDEQQNVVLSQAVYVDIAKTGTYDSNSELGTFNQYKIAAGTAVDSQMLYFDPLHKASVSNVTFTVSGQILGVIVESDRFYNTAHGDTDYFVASDFLGNPLTAYPTAHFTNRGLELGSADSISVDFASNTVTLNLTADSPGDQIRIITAAVPEPSSLALVLGVGLLGGGYTAARRRHHLAG